MLNFFIFKDIKQRIGDGEKVKKGNKGKGGKVVRDLWSIRYRLLISLRRIWRLKAVEGVLGEEGLKGP